MKKMKRMKKYFVFCCYFALCFNYIQAQNSSFSIKITQVYPAGGVVYGNMYNLSGELDKAEQKLRSQYNGKNANYIMELTRPGGKETKYIQNIHWILTENNKTTNYQTKPEFKDYYSESTVVVCYACDIYGKQKSNSKKEEFEYNYYYSFFKGDTVVPFHKVKDTVWTLDDCRKKATACFTAHAVDTLLCSAKIYDSKGTLFEEWTIDNRTEYKEYLYQKHIADSLQAAEVAARTKQEELRADSIRQANAEPVYSKQDIEKQLEQLQAKVDSLKKGDNDYRQNINSIIDEAEKLVTVLKVDSATFDKNKYFGTLDIKDLKKGLKKMTEINKKEEKQK
ncbi:MAG: hypothetical protein LBF70_02155 [Holosporales bacterium]|jgi:hypothetical protein|nr:hypothetical protein [Holosporales bacterium]